MRKRILSLLLALTLVLSAGVFGVIPALAANSCVSVKADAVTTGEVVAGSLLEIKLTDVFEDTDGHTLTYTLTNAAQFSAQTKVKDGSLYVSEKDPGTYTPKVKATCSDGKELTATFTITVTEAPHGLDAQYNYDETPAKEVTVYVTISNDGVPIRGRDGTVLCHKAITVPYFDLGRYNLTNTTAITRKTEKANTSTRTSWSGPPACTCISICWSATSSACRRSNAARVPILVTRWRALSWVKMFVIWMKHRPIRQTALPL